MKPAFLVDLRVYRDYLMRTFRIALVITVFEMVALQSMAPVPGMMGTILLIGCAQTGLTNDSHGWECARLVMPISRREVVYARYCIAAAVGLLAALLGAVICVAVGLVASGLDLPAEQAAAFALTAENLGVMALSSSLILLVGCVMLGILLAVGFKLGMTKTTQQLPFILLLVTLVPLIMLSALGMMDNSPLDALVASQGGVLDGLFAQGWVLILTCVAIVCVGLVVLALTAQLAAKFYEARDF